MFFGVYNTTNDSGSDTCSEKAALELFSVLLLHFSL
jgi:hypothetical protein